MSAVSLTALDGVTVYSIEATQVTGTAAMPAGQLPTGVAAGTSVFYQGTTYQVLGAKATVDAAIAAGTAPSINILASNEANATTALVTSALGFDVVAAASYYFRFVIRYTVASASLTGACFGLTGPALTSLIFNETQGQNSAVALLGNVSIVAYDTPATAAAAGATNSNPNGNIAILEGFITCSSAGRISLRWASETAGQAVTLIAGSNVTFKRVL